MLRKRLSQQHCQKGGEAHRLPDLPVRHACLRRGRGRQAQTGLIEKLQGKQIGARTFYWCKKKSILAVDITNIIFKL